MFAMLGEQLTARASAAEALHGWMFVGFVLDALLLGIMTTQVHGYYAAYSKKDKAWLQIFVAVLYLALALTVVFFFIYLYRVLIPFFGDADMLLSPHWVLATQPAVTGFVTLSVQLFFSWRVYALTKSKIMGGLVAALALTSGGATVATTCEIVRGTTVKTFQRLKNSITLGLAAAVACDIAITTVLVIYLQIDPLVSQNRHKSGFPRSDMIVKRIIRVTMQTGLVTMIVATGDMILFLSDSSGKHLMLGGALGGLYATSLMTSLNSRKGWKFGESENTDSGGVGSLSVNRDLRVTSMKPNTFIDTRTHPGVFVHVESHQLSDVSSPGSSHSKDKARSFGPESDAE
ncbi:hypothetical protein NLJ89_g8514 [Agrocybe chaxingu]|uniref:DUF6534 domain-containing protein n=1 Tax=Agrocybe chaxingu TaxID=84603 RepID=A0A9W8MQP6_9AGAR|nr:hypothetical protein NLJ89_g8514 [Agrocybe chaxingu]